MLIRLTLLLLILSLPGCDEHGRGEAGAGNGVLLDAHVDSLNAVARARMRVRESRVLHERPDYVGLITDTSPAGATSRSITVRYEPLPWQPAVGQRTVTFAATSDLPVWDGDGQRLPPDSLKVGDAVKLWVRSSVVTQPIEPPTIAIRAVQRIDSLPAEPPPGRPAA